MSDKIDDGVWTGHKVRWDGKSNAAEQLPIQQVGACKYIVDVPEGYEDCKELLLQIRYFGDIGNAFVDGILISDNFCNGAVWEIGLEECPDYIMGKPITIVITPMKDNSSVNVSSTMAGRLEENQGQKGWLDSVMVQLVYQAKICIGDDR